MTTYLSGERIQGSSTTKTHTTLTFNSNGTFTPSAGISVNYVVVGGGGGGARDAYSGQRGSGGGGAGAYRESGVTSSDTAFTSSNTAYTITVGTGGTGGGASPDTSEASVAGGNGNNSSISGSGLTTITSNGGGGGGGHSTSSNYAGNANGNASGGGGSNGLSGGSGGTYGNNGGSGGGTPYSGGGGGGSNSTGSNGSGGNGGNGGSGKTPSTTYFSSSALAGGGGGNGGTSTGTGQAGGGSGSQSGSANAGTANTGGGGGGSRGFQAGAGGSGVVIISVPIGSSYSTTGSPTVGEAGSQDDKTTITNVPEGTRFEETDTRKIYRCKLTGDPKFDFSNNTGWTQYGTGVSIDTTDEEMDYNPAAASADKRLSYDLGAGNVSDTAWTLRWTFTPTATTSPAGFIMPTLISSNSAYGSGTTVDQIACRFGEQQGGSPAGDFLQLEYTNGASLDSGTGATPCVTASMNTTYYCEMLRNSTTSITLNVRTGSHTGSHATNSPETITNMPSAVGGLRYIMFSNYPPSPSGRSMTSTIDDLEFFNGNNTASGTKVSWVEKGTA